MSWRELGQVFADGDVVSPHDLNDTFIPSLSEINGHIDRDNFGYRLITDAKIVVNVVNRVWHDETDTPMTASGGSVVPILQVTIDADEWITVRASFTAIGAPQIYPFLLVGDVMVHIGNWTDITLSGTRSVSWSGPVAPGVQVVTLGIGIGYDGTSVTVNSRGMTVVESRR